MTSISQLLAQGIEHQQAGRLQQAEAAYRQVLDQDKHQPDAWHLLGTIAHRIGDFKAAIDLIGHAIDLDRQNASYHCNLGNSLMASGQYDAAEVSYRRALKRKRDFPLAYFNLAALQQQQGRSADALTSYAEAIRLHPQFAEAHYNRGVIHQDQRNWDSAVADYQRTLQIAPQHASAWNNLGLVVKEQGNLAGAVECHLRAVQCKPDFAEAFNNLGVVYRERRELNLAVDSYAAALRLKPDYAVAYNNLGNALLGLGRPADAVTFFKRAIELQPNFAEAFNNLGSALQDLRRLNEAAECHRAALHLKPDYAAALQCLGNVIRDEGDSAQALACYQRALELEPDSPELHNNIAVALRDRGMTAEAITLYQKARELAPHSAEIQRNLASSMTDAGEFLEAIACYRRSLELKPTCLAALGQLVHQLQHICQWDEVTDLAKRAIDAIERDVVASGESPMAPFAFMTLPIETTSKQQLQCARRWADYSTRAAVSIDPATRGKRRDGDSRIRIGYLSADFRAHPVADLIVELFEVHDRNRFAITGYSYGPDDGSALRKRIASAFETFVDFREVSFAESARRIAADGVDILVDLTGFTQHARTQIMASRPAPIQVNYLGYPSTTGANFIDYIMVDEFIVPMDRQPYFSENIVHLPGCYQVNDTKRVISDRLPTRQEFGLPDDGFVFCSFNNNYKITAEVFDVWMDLLREVPSSVLWLLEGNKLAPANLRREAERRGIDSQRLLFAPRRPLPEHLARHQLADLFLDTFPVNAHTTASDALWAGLPVLTLSGESFVTRVAGSLLRTMGLPELVTTNLHDYKYRALQLASNREELLSIRTRLQQNRLTSPVFDVKSSARAIERAYETMVQIHQSGARPHGFAVAEDQRDESSDHRVPPSHLHLSSTRSSSIRRDPHSSK